MPVHLEPDPAALSARVADPERVAHALSELADAGLVITEFALGQPSLDEVFLALTGRPAQSASESESDHPIRPGSASAGAPSEKVTA